MKESFEEIDNMDIILSTKVLIRSEYPKLLLKYYENLLNETKELSIDNKKVYLEMTKLMKEEKISAEFKTFMIFYNKFKKQIIINFTIALKIEKKFLLLNELNSNVKIILDYTTKEIYYYVSEIKINYFIGDEMVSYIDLENIQFKEHFLMHMNKSEESKIKILLNILFIDEI